MSTVLAFLLQKQRPCSNTETASSPLFLGLWSAPLFWDLRTDEWVGFGFVGFEVHPYMLRTCTYAYYLYQYCTAVRTVILYGHVPTYIVWYNLYTS